MKKPPPTSPQNRIEDLANRLQKENKLDQLGAELVKFDPTGLEGVEKESWYHIYGIAAFHAGDHAEAFARFQEGLKQCPDSADLAFSLGQEYEYKGDVQSMLELFDRCPFPKISGAYTLAKARYAYLWNRNMKGLEYLRPLMDVYFKVKILDSTFLYIRRLPFFEQTWECMAAFYYLLGDLSEMKALTDRAERTCHECDFERLRLKLTALETGDYSPLMEPLKEYLAQATQNGWPVGYTTLQLRIFEAQVEADFAKAEQILDSAKFAANDFPWLDDMRLLARCELAHRARDDARETELRTQFLKKQPLLFEPNNALNFNLLTYQEKLKKEYQARRRAG